MDVLLFLLVCAASIAILASLLSRLSRATGVLVLVLAVGLVGALLLQPKAYVVGNLPGLGEPARGGPIAINYGSPEQHLVVDLPFSVGDVHDLRTFLAGTLGFVVLAGLLLGMRLKRSRPGP